MALGDITILQKEGSSFGAVSYRVGNGQTVINAGEPVSPFTAGLAGLASSTVIAAVTSSPITGTTAAMIGWLGIAATTSTQTTLVEGKVDVYPLLPGTVYLASPKTGTSWDTQAEYDALVGARVTMDLTAGSYTINATDSYLNGLVIAPLNIALYPGKVAFKIKTVTDTLLT